jgi:hypothetical protein
MSTPMNYPPNWRMVPLPAGAEQRLFRAASLGLATDDERRSCPAGLQWLDLRTLREVDIEGVPPLPDDWSRSHIDLTPDVLVSAEAISLMAAEFVSGRLTFGDLYVRMLADNASTFGEALTVLAEAQRPVAITCQAGRDRTGLVVALVLLILGATRDEIVADYLATNNDLERFLTRSASNQTFGVSDFSLDLTCHARDIEQAMDYLDSVGGVDSYLDGAGFPVLLRRRLQENFVSTVKVS